MIWFTHPSCKRILIKLISLRMSLLSFSPLGTDLNPLSDVNQMMWTVISQHAFCANIPFSMSDTHSLADCYYRKVYLLTGRNHGTIHRTWLNCGRSRSGGGIGGSRILDSSNKSNCEVNFYGQSRCKQHGSIRLKWYTLPRLSALEGTSPLLWRKVLDCSPYFFFTTARRPFFILLYLSV